MKEKTLNLMWSDYYKYYDGVAEKCNKKREKSRQIKRFEKNDYVIECTSEIGYCEIECKPRFVHYYIELKDKTTNERYMFEHIEADYSKRKEASEKANETFKKFLAMAI